MRQPDSHWQAALALIVLLLATHAHARRLLETDGIELRGSVQVVAYSAATCHIREINHSAEEYERLKVNEGKPLDLWRLEFSVYNGSGKALDHLIARYDYESPWPPCTNWTGPVDEYPEIVRFTSAGGNIQRSGLPYAVAPGETLTEEILVIAFHGDEPRFSEWSVDFNFARGVQAPAAAPPAATPADPPAATPAEPPAAQPTQAQAAPPPPAQTPGLPSGVSAGETCAGKAEGTACWKELADQSGCYVWDDYLVTDQTVSWSADCAGGLAQGEGALTWRDADGKTTTSTGQLQDGKRHGHWVERDADGDVGEGPYVDGKQHGQWVFRNSEGVIRLETTYVNGENVDTKHYQKQ